MKNIETIFEASGITDAKHILNTSTKKVSEDILREIEDGGVTTERLQEFIKNGMDIYQYQTQITIHGIFPELFNNYLGGYKTLFQNKNKSIGVKWQAIDTAKKKRIYGLCGLTGWSTIHNSSDWFAQKASRFSSRAEAAEKCLQYKEEIKRIDTKLFWGGVNVFVGAGMFGVYYAVAEVWINGILKENVDKVIEQITGKNLAELDEIYNEKKREKEKWYAEFNANWEADQKVREQKKNELAEKKKAFAEANPLSEFAYSANTPVKKGQIFAFVNDDIEWQYALISKIGANFFEAQCDVNGVKIGKNKFFYRKNKSGYLKK